MAKFDAAQGRIYRRRFVCKNCKTKIRTDASKIIQKKVGCPKCGGKAFRPLRKK
ncbi:MAG: hypothetical protein ABIB71_05870 [Candidatus Woesearchaeota archaeon]